MKLRDWIFKQSLFWSKHIHIIKALLIIACVLPLVDIEKILSVYIQMLVVVNSIFKALALPVTVITVIASVIYTVVYIKKNET